MKNELSKTGNLEKFKKYAVNRGELQKVTGGKWVWINGQWVWKEDK